MNKVLILNMIQEYYGYKKDGDFADFLGIKQNTLSNWKTRDSIDYDRIIEKCDKINGHWLLTGKGSMLKIDNGDPRNTPVIVNNKDVIERLERENALKDKVISGLERENQLLREARESNQDKSKPSHAVANVTGSKTELITK